MCVSHLLHISVGTSHVSSAQLPLGGGGYHIGQHSSRMFSPQAFARQTPTLPQNSTRSPPQETFLTLLLSPNFRVEFCSTQHPCSVCCLAFSTVYFECFPLFLSFNGWGATWRQGWCLFSLVSSALAQCQTYSFWKWTDAASGTGAVWPLLLAFWFRCRTGN